MRSNTSTRQEGRIRSGLSAVLIKTPFKQNRPVNSVWEEEEGLMRADQLYAVSVNFIDALNLAYSVVYAISDGTSVRHGKSEAISIDPDVPMVSVNTAGSLLSW